MFHFGAYHWSSNCIVFKVLYSSYSSRHFIDKLTEHINDWNNGEEGEHVSLKAAIVQMAVGFQKPKRKSKAKDHQECLAKRLALWKEGDVGTLLREGVRYRDALQAPRELSSPTKQKCLLISWWEGKSILPWDIFVTTTEEVFSR
jgi:hypothetical protein